MSRCVGCKDGNRDTSWEATVVIHLRDDGGLDKGDSNGNRHSEYVDLFGRQSQDFLLARQGDGKDFGS